MAQFYVVEDGFLVSHGYAQDGTEGLQAKAGQTVVIGDVPGYEQQAFLPNTSKWHLDNRCWKRIAIEEINVSKN